MKKTYEYRRIPCRYDQSPEDILNRWGSEGWELCSVEAESGNSGRKYFYMKKENLG